MSVAIATPDDNNLSAFEQFVQQQEPAKALFIAIGSYLDCPAILSEASFKVLLHLLNIVDYEDFSKPVIMSVPTLGSNTGMAKETVQRALKELIAKRFIDYVSGHYEKERAYAVRKEKFHDTRQTRSYNEPNAYRLEEAVKVGLFISWLKNYAREQGINMKEVREVLRATSYLQDLYIYAVLEKPATKVSMRKLREKLPELPGFLNVLVSPDEIGQKLANLPDEIGQKLGNQIGQKLANQIGQKLGNQIYQILGKAPLLFNPPQKNHSLKNTHTQAPAEKNLASDAQPTQTLEPQGSEKPSRPADQLPDIVREALLNHLRRQGTAKSPLAVLKTLSEAEIRELAREALSEELRYNYELQEEIDRIVEQLPEVSEVELLEYVLLSEDGKLEWLDRRGVRGFDERGRGQEVELIKEIVEKVGDLVKVQEVIASVFRGNEAVWKIWHELREKGVLYIENGRVEWRDSS